MSDTVRPLQGKAARLWGLLKDRREHTVAELFCAAWPDKSVDIRRQMQMRIGGFISVINRHACVKDGRIRPGRTKGTYKLFSR